MRPLTAAPRPGSRGISQMYCISAVLGSQFHVLGCRFQVLGCLVLWSLVLTSTFCALPPHQVHLVDVDRLFRVHDSRLPITLEPISATSSSIDALSNEIK